MTPYRMFSVLVSRHLRRVACAVLNLMLLAVFPAFGAGWTDIDIGGSTTPGTRVDLTNGWRIQASGREIGGIADQFYFTWREEPGDFDYAVRIGRLDNTDVWAKAGLMLRESLEPGAGFAATFASPSLAGCFMQTRRSAGAVAQPAGSHPANFPETWLRLKRVGSDVTAYAGLNGENWEVLGTTELSQTNATYFGSAVCSRSTNALCTAEFYDLRTATDFGPPEWPYAMELPGPSSRRTSLAITEIMYNPGPNAQGYQTRFIEIFNSNPFFEDVSGYRLAGTIDYTFPEGTILEGGQYLVVAAVPAAVETVYGISGVLGPYTGTLGRDGALRLLDRTGGILLELDYNNNPPWPVSADGFGHSLVLARPSYGERSPKAWSASGRKGGSPGRLDGQPGNPMSSVRINEVRVMSASVDDTFVELYNPGRREVALSGMRIGLGKEGVASWYELPAGNTLGSNQFIRLAPSELGLAAAQPGTSIVLETPDRSSIVDAVSLSDEARVGSLGRYPDGSSKVQLLKDPSPGLSNQPPVPGTVVINEIMYRPISGDERDEYVELHNPTATPVDVGGWTFTDGISFLIPAGRVIPPGGYLVIAKDASHLLNSYTALSTEQVIGDFDGKLSGSGEQITLARPISSSGASQTMVVVESFSYGTSGRWGTWADGGGSSLERRDPKAPADFPSSWADSETTDGAPWKTIETTGVLDNGGNIPDALHVMLLGAGECLIDDVQVFAEGGTSNLVANSSFDAGLKGWTVLGNHIQSSLSAQGGYADGPCLHLKATGRGDTGPNQVRVPLVGYNALQPNRTATLRAKVRWLKGFPEVLLRVRGNYLEAFARLNLPAASGTPGRENTRRVANGGPAIAEVTHLPVLPASDAPVRVLATVWDAQGVSGVWLNYRVDPGTNVVSVQMHDDGTGGDSLAGDRVFTGIVAGQAAGTLVAFNVTATDAADAVATSRFPESNARECLVRFGEVVPASSFGNYRLWLTASNLATWRSRPVLSNEELDGTFVYGNRRAVYNVGGRYSGSPWHQSSYSSPVGSPCTYALTMPGDDPVLGATSFNKVHVPGNTPADDATLQCEQTAYWMVKQLGLPANHQRYIVMFVNGIRRGQLMEDTQVPAGDVLEERFPGDSDGQLYKLNGWYEFQAGTGQVLQHTLHSWCTLNDYTTTGGVKKIARYRWNFSPRSESRTANDYSALFGLIDAANAPADDLFVENLRGQADIDQWLRTFAIEHAVGNWDSFGNRNAQNMYAYKPSQDRWKLLIWDFNIVLGNSGSDGPSGDDLFQYNGADRVMRHIYQEPEFVRAYMRTLQDIASGPMAGPAVERLVDARFAAFRASGITASAPNAIKSWISSRRRYLQTTTGRYNAPFTMEETPAPATNQNWTTLRGTAPLAVASIVINGVAYAVQWETRTNWSVIVPLHSGANTLAVQGLDAQAQPVAGTAASATVVFPGTEPGLAGNLVINEILHHPQVPGAEYVELVNRSPAALDLTGLRLQGIDYDFPVGTLMMPGEFQLLVKSRFAFGSTYGFTLPVSGEFPGQLSASGETLRIVRDPGPGIPAQTIDEVTFGTQPPWPVAADQAGVSMQLIDSSKDNSLAEQWTAVTPAEAASPPWKFVSVTGVGSDSRLLVYHSPYEVAPDPLALEGRWVGSIDFQGQPYQMSVEFERLGSNQWSGVFIGEDITNPLGGIRFTFPTVNFAFADFPVPITFSGRMSTNGLTINGTLTQSTPQGQQSAPFKLERDQASQKFGGEVYMDDIKLVKGTDAAVGENLVRNGDFEAPLAAAWNIGTNHTATLISTATKHSGNASLKLVASFGGRDLESSVWQQTLALSPGEAYTLSYWYLPSTNGNELTVRLADGQLMSSHPIAPDRIATPGMPNVQRSLSATNPPALPAVLINEWMAANSSGIADPADSVFEDWFELYNAEAHAVDLSGYTLTDSAANKAKWRIPDGTSIPARGFLLVWADEDTDQNSPGSALHVNFKLSQSGENIGLFAPNGALVDWVTFGPQSTDISEGRGANGGSGNWVRFQTGTPGTSNTPQELHPLPIKAVGLDAGGSVFISWLTTPGRQYQVEYTDTLSATAWSTLGAPVTSSGNEASIVDPESSTKPARFYRVVGIAQP